MSSERTTFDAQKLKLGVQRFMDRWPDGYQLNIYTQNGFSVQALSPRSIHQVSDELIEGTDPFGHRFLVTMEHIVLMTLTERKRVAIKKGRSGSAPVVGYWVPA